MPLKLLLPGTLYLGTALAALLGCQREPAPAPTPLNAEATSATSTSSSFVRPGVVNSQASLQAIKNGWSKYEESLQGSTQCKSCQGASDNAIFPAIETAYNYYGGSTLQKLHDRGAPYGLISPDNTFSGFSSFTHRGIGQVR